MATVWLPLFEAVIKVWLPCGYAWLPILNPYRKSVATRVIKKKIFKQVTIEILDLSLYYKLWLPCGYHCSRALLKCGYAWLPILNPYGKSVATRVIKKNIFKQVTIEMLDLSLYYKLWLPCGYRVATIVRGPY